MSRNITFSPTHEPFRHVDELSLEHEGVSGPFSFLNPTRAHYHLRHREKAPEGVRFHWRSRDNRKGRHALKIADGVDSKTNRHLPQTTNTPAAVSKGIIRMFTVFPVWDISYLVALIFTLGSVVWVINGFFAWLPLVDPSTSFPNEVYLGGGITAFLGAILFFETGSILLMFEAINENNAGCFGWAFEQLYGESAGAHIIAKKEHCFHHHQNKGNFVGHGLKGSKTDSETLTSYKQDIHGSDKAWQWWPSWKSCKTHYFHELGFLASFSQFCGATIFGMAGFTSLPGIYNHLENNQGLLDGVYWVPQVVGGSGFIISGTLYLLETQEKWYKPAWGVLGWHIAFWNLIGGIGFTLCGALGMAYGNSGAEYEASLATFWGSWAFLIGSLIQLYESLDKFPVENQ